MIRTDSRQIILSILGISILIIAFVGISYAAFATQSFESGISTGTISLTFDNPIDSISIQNAMPISDEQGMSLTGEGNVYDFTVHTILSEKTTINYEISAEKIDTGNPQLDNDSIRLYLEKQTTNGFVSTPITSSPQPFIPIDKNSFLGSKAGTMILYSDTFSNSTSYDQEVSQKFRLRIWVDEDTIIDSVSRDFKIRLNVTAKVI